MCATREQRLPVLVVETSSKKLYELYNATQTELHSRRSAPLFRDLTKHYPDCCAAISASADAAGLPMSALLATSDEVANGEIPHALRFILPNAHEETSLRASSDSRRRAVKCQR